MSDMPNNAETPDTAAAASAPDTAATSVEQQLAELQAKHAEVSDAYLRANRTQNRYSKVI